jgi:hypothetical protein
MVDRSVYGPLYVNISMLMMAIMTIYTTWDNGWYALVRNSHNNTQERRERCKVGYFTLPVLLVLALLVELGPMAVEAYWNRNGFYRNEFRCSETTTAEYVKGRQQHSNNNGLL